MHDINTDKLIQLLLEKDDFIDQLKSQIANLENSLHNEMEVNESLSDMNIELKGLLSGRPKVIPHPSSLKKLTEAVQRYAKRIEELQDALVFAVDMIPASRNVIPHIERLKYIAHKLA